MGTQTRLGMILTQEEIKRIIFKLDAEGRDEITMDLHKLTVKEAKRLIGNVIAIERGECNMNLIHGYNHGTAIRTMIMDDLNSPRIRAKSREMRNPGLTRIKIACAA